MTHFIRLSRKEDLIPKISSIEFQTNIVEDAETIPDNSVAFNETYQALRINDSSSNLKGSIHIPVGFLRSGDLVQVDLECMNISGEKVKAALDLHSTPKQTGFIDVMGIAQSEKQDEFETLKASFIAKEDGYGTLVIGVFTADIGDFYLRNIRYSKTTEEILDNETIQYLKEHGIGSANFRSQTDPDDLLEAGFYYVTLTNGLPYGQAGYLLVQQQSDDNSLYVLQEYIHYSGTNGKYRRIKNDGVWSEWSRVEITLNNTLTSSSTTQAATANAVRLVNNKVPEVETGSWTPNVSMRNDNGVFATRIGKYVKVGKMVTATFTLSVTTPPSGDMNFFFITGLPFYSESTSMIEYGVSFGNLSGVHYPGSTARTMTGFLSGDLISIRFHSSVDGTSYSSFAHEAIKSGAEISGSVTYEIR